jgi:hypothetical protein
MQSRKHASTAVLEKSRRRNKPHKILVLVLIVTALTTVGFSKCANRFIYIEGHITGRSSSNLEILVQTAPDANSQSPAIAIQGKDFAGKIYFDSTKAEGRFRHDCSRTPKLVRLLLLENGKQVDLIELSIEKDFVRDTTGDFRISSPAKLHLQ